MIDGIDGDVCDFRLTATGGWNVGPPDPPGTIRYDQNEYPPCAGDIIEYYLDPYYADWFDWEVSSNGKILSGQKTRFVRVKWTEPGFGSVFDYSTEILFPRSTISNRSYCYRTSSYHISCSFLRYQLCRR
ncbi:MAG: hypothetical protein R2784_03885 [Saprospiraceae bacterium]